MRATFIAAVMLLTQASLALAQTSPSPGGAPGGSQACKPPHPDSAPKLSGSPVAAPDDTKLPGGPVACPANAGSGAATKTDPGAGVMTTSPTGMMTNPGLQPMPDAPRTAPPK